MATWKFAKLGKIPKMGRIRKSEKTELTYGLFRLFSMEPIPFRVASGPGLAKAAACQMA